MGGRQACITAISVTTTVCILESHRKIVHLLSQVRVRNEALPAAGRFLRQTPETRLLPNRSSVQGGSRWSDGLTGMLRHFLDQLHLDHVDTGDLLLLVLLFFLFREDADEELLVALGLLLIL